MATIQIKRSQTTATPATLAVGELAYSENSNTLFIGATGNVVTAIAGTGQFTKKTDPLTVTGDVTGTGTHSGGVAVTLSASGVAAGTYNSSATQSQSFTVDAKGRITGVGAAVTLTPAWSSITGKPTAISGLALSDLTGASATTPLVNGVAAVGTSTTYARADHVHPSDTSKVNTSMLGVANGVATLDAGGKLTAAQIPAVMTGAMVFQSTWNAATNTPVITSGVGTKGHYYKVSTAGTTLIDGINSWQAGDMIVFNGTTWDKIDGGQSEVLSVAGRTGAITLTAADVSGVATSGANTNITSLSGLTTALSVAQGGTGTTAITGIVKGNGAGAMSAAIAGTDYLAPSSIIDGGVF